MILVEYAKSVIANVKRGLWQRSVLLGFFRQLPVHYFDDNLNHASVTRRLS